MVKSPVLILLKPAEFHLRQSFIADVASCTSAPLPAGGDRLPAAGYHGPAQLDPIAGERAPSLADAVHVPSPAPLDGLLHSGLAGSQAGRQADSADSEGNWPPSSQRGVTTGSLQ